MTEQPQTLSLSELEMPGDFIRRHIGPNREQIDAMLATLGYDSVDALIDAAVPDHIRLKRPLDLKTARSERVIEDYLRRMRSGNRALTSMIGMGYHDTIMPNVIKRNVLENPGWYTAYTPYQAEISQGRLQALLNFQQMIIDLTGLAVANASLLDEATAAAEAMMLSRRVNAKAGSRFLVDSDCHPQTLAVLQTRARPLGIDIVTHDLAESPDAADLQDCFGVLVQYPGSSGRIIDLAAVSERAHAAGALVTAACDPLALVLLKSPGDLGADIAVGSTQRFGVPLAYGGPHAAFFATHDTYKRQIPGRIIGVSRDARGRPALRMALQTREQHIRREKATSNICTSQVLLAVIASMYAVYHGPKGLGIIAERVHRMALLFARGIEQLGYRIVSDTFFDTVTIHTPGVARRLAAKARAAGFNLRVHDADHVSVAFDETSRRSYLDQLWSIFAPRQRGLDFDIMAMDTAIADCLAQTQRRSDAILTHPVFNRYHSETEMLRYLRWLASRDIALDRSMIPLGSCTMKLNATIEMLPVTYQLFSGIHPFVPLDQAQGYQQLIEELEDALCEITGFAAFSFQPNSGAQGEYAGLLTIARYHEARGQQQRNICLIPASAHGTNPASAQMAGMQVVVVACDERGNIDVANLKAKAEQHADDLAALMVTYPSTHGVFEESIVEICEIIHAHGGQVYLDGANMNAMVGICRPAAIGVDVCHLNLHKTFCIPHGGGGPGAGPIGVAPHLASWLPDHPVVPGVNPAAGTAQTVGTVAAAPWGSAGILPITWTYIALMGGDGLTRASQIAILNANYIARQLESHYPVLYTGLNGLVAHECIIDLRPLKDSTGITVEDVAKRLIDYGFHAPTISFPVAGTMMIEPTESESQAEIDRFCTAMIRIRAEIAAVERGDADRDNNVLKNAPHTHELLLEDDWPFSYSRETAFFPLASQHDNKYWPTVMRIDNMHGDRELICTCPPVSAYEDNEPEALVSSA
ncbi:glycine dehydrogenase [Methylohalomonas lacus]|uniref:Glycine dehydrogenase (decarboxylating) n=1 Tax=Methylohalomonas lacus TaxID=398773 RepID=A0AAE3HNF0_9GAMM|nr:aminomethyl-transferring glycine dehydrogenase [Methylohalomonas lacus]MCS3903673.1 glycine dehydrogenase [Methylohalomonas lacus]